MTQRVDDTYRVTLDGNVHPLARARFDQGPASGSFVLNHVLLVLRRGAEQETVLRALIEDLHNPSSPSFHHWLTPVQIGDTFGLAGPDIAAVLEWLRSRGIIINRVSKAGTVIQLSGTASQMEEAFHTPIRRYLVGDQVHYANSLNPQIPVALAPVIAGVAGLNDFYPTPNIIVRGDATYSATTNQAQPHWTYPDGADHFNLVFAPEDFNTQYNIPSTADGAGVTIGIVGGSNVDMPLVAAYRSLFDLGTANLPNVIIDGTDPGVLDNDATAEAYLDLELAGAVARNATINFYVSISISDAALRAVDDDDASVLSLSFGDCEANLGTSGNGFWSTLWQQAAAQGQTVMVAAGDAGSAGCDDFRTEGLAQGGLAVNGYASSPYNIAVGGTDFFYSDYGSGSNETVNAQLAQYWNLSTTLAPRLSLLRTIPEQPWNRPFGLNVDDYGIYDASKSSIIAGGGGASSCAVSITGSNGNTCSAGYATPAWQVGPGVPNNDVRNLPDVSLYASNEGNYSYYPICAKAADCTTNNPSAKGGAVQISAAGGTSASTPAFAAIMALVNQATASRQGQANYSLYKLAAQYPKIFNDITVGSNNVPCEAGTPHCSLSAVVGDPAYGSYSLGQYYATVGYDQATGLGSVNVGNLLSNWTKLTYNPTTTTLSATPLSFQHGTFVTFTAVVAGVAGTPTGNVALISSLATEDGKGLGDLPLGSNGAGSRALNSLQGGSYLVYGRYGGDGFFASSQSDPITLAVTPEDSKLRMVGVAFNSAKTSAHTFTSGGQYPYGTYILINGEVSGASGSTGLATGTMTFTDALGNASSGALSLNSSSTGTWSPSAWAAGSHSISAKYSGDTSYYPSGSTTPFSFTISAGVPTIGLVSDASVYTTVQTATLKATVDTTSAYSGPTGSITFYLDASPLGAPVALVSGLDKNGYPEGTASFSVMALPEGVHSLTAEYTGDSNFAAILSQPTVVSVGAPFALAATTVAIPARGGSGTSTVTVTAFGGFKGQVNLTCSLNSSPQGVGLAKSPVCSVPSSVSISGTTVQTTASFTTPTLSGSVTHPHSQPHDGLILAGIDALAAMTLLLGFTARRRLVDKLVLAVLLGAIVQAVGCGSTSGTPQGAYTFTIMGRDSAQGSISSSFVVTVIVN